MEVDVGRSNHSARPAVSSKPSIRFMFCTAAPEAPLPRLSNRAVTVVRSCAAADDELQAVLVRHGVGGDHGLVVTQLCHRHQGAAVIVSLQGFPDVLCRGLAREQAILQQNGGGHTFIIVVHDGAEHRREIQTGYRLHFRQVLVVQGQAVDTGGEEFIGSVLDPRTRQSCSLPPPE